MANGLILKNVSAEPKFRSIEDILKDEHAKTKLNALVDEAVQARQRIATEKIIIKDLREMAKDDIKLSPKLFNFYVNAAVNNDYTSRKTSLEEMISLIDGVIGIEYNDAGN